MSQKNVIPATVVEWSPTQVSYIGSNHERHFADSFEELVAVLPSRDIVVAVSRRNAFLRATRVPNAPKAEVRRILQVQIGQLFPIAAHDLSFDFHLANDVNAEGRLAIVAAVR